MARRPDVTARRGDTPLPYRVLCASCGRRLSKVAPLTETARTSSPVPIPSGAVVLASIPSATLHGVDGRSVSVEVHVSSGLPGFTVVGLPDAAVRESRDRVRAALLSSHLPWPARRVTVNLAPSGVKKSGAGLDLAIAMGLLVAAETLPPACVAGTGFVGELGLDGSVRPVPGIVSLVAAIPDARVVVPAEAAGEARLVVGE